MALNDRQTAKGQRERRREASRRFGFPARLLFLFGLVFLISGSPVLAGKPTRIVSINLSADQLLLQLVEPENIAALSQLAIDPELSQLADQAAGIPTTKGTAEEILRLQPDLVFAGQFTNTTTLDLLRRLGVPVFELPIPETFDEIRDLIARVAEAVGEAERGRALVEEMNRRLETLRADVEECGGGERSVLSVGQSGYTQGVNSLMNAIVEAAGLRNAAGDFGMAHSGDLTVEALLLSPPDFLVFSPYREEHATLGGQWLNHRALRKVRDRMKIIEIPMEEVVNGNNLTVGASEKLWLASRQCIDGQE